MKRRVDFPIYLITDRHRLAAGHTLLSACEAALCGGITAIQLREKDLPAVELLPMASELRFLTRQYDALLLINDRVDVALACDADGVHLGGHSLPADTVRALLGPDKLIGVSTHRHEEIAEAGRRGADFVTFGPVFATPSKTAFGPPRGVAHLRDACLHTALPVYALGGIQTGNQADVLSAGAAGVALISGVLAQQDPETAARRLCDIHRRLQSDNISPSA